MKPKLALPRQIAYAVDDLDPRLSGMVGFALTFTAGLVFTRYNEEKVLGELAETETG